jgi:hypothetical protein
MPENRAGWEAIEKASVALELDAGTIQPDKTLLLK